MAVPPSPSQPRAYVAIEEQLRLIRDLTDKGSSYAKVSMNKSRSMFLNSRAGMFTPGAAAAEAGWATGAMADGLPLYEGREVVFGKDMKQLTATLLQIADPYFIDRPIARMLEDTLSSVPADATLQPSDFPSPAGFVWIDEPHGWALPTETPGGYRHYLKAFAWGAVNSIDLIFWGYSTQPAKGQMVVRGVAIDDFAELNELAIVTIHVGDTVSSNAYVTDMTDRFIEMYGGPDGVYSYSWLDTEADPARFDPRDPVKAYLRETDIRVGDWADKMTAHDMSCVRAATAVIHFMNQRITTVAKRPLPRAVDRRIDPEWKKRVVNVIQLRARDYQPRESQGEESGREYHTRWVVRGHWRHYWCAGGSKDCLHGGKHESQRELRYILPYVAGPEGAPVQGATKLFAVTR